MDEQKRRRQDDRRDEQQRQDQQAAAVRAASHRSAINATSNLNGLLGTFESLGGLPSGTASRLLGRSRLEQLFDPLPCSQEEIKAAFVYPFRWPIAHELQEVVSRYIATGSIIVDAAPTLRANAVRIFADEKLHFAFPLVSGIAFPLTFMQRFLVADANRAEWLAVETWSGMGSGATFWNRSRWRWPELGIGPVQIRVTMEYNTNWTLGWEPAASRFRIVGGANEGERLVRAWWGSTVIGTWPITANCDIPTAVPEGRATFTLELLENRPTTPRLFEVIERVAFPAAVRGPVQISASYLPAARKLGEAFLFSSAGRFDSRTARTG